MSTKNYLNNPLPSTWSMTRLKHVSSIRYGKALATDNRDKTGKVPVYGSSVTTGYHDVAFHLKPSIVIGRKGSVGSVQYVDVPFWPIDTVFFLDDVSPHIDLRFLAAALTYFGLDRYKIVVGVPGINRSDLENFQFPLPPLSEQRRIVEILQEAEQIRHLRSKAESKTAELIPAMFYDHFMDGKERDFQPLHKLAEIVSGVAIGRKSKGMTCEVPYLRVANVQAGFVDLNEVKTTSATDEEVIQFGLKNGDVLLTEGGDFDKLGRGCLWEGQVEPCIHQNHVFRVRPMPGKLNSHFFAHYLQSAKAKHYFLRCAKKTTNLASINLTQLKALPVPKISIEDQERFELQIQAASECSLAIGNKTLFALTRSLSAHAFSGQLTADWREANKDKLGIEARERDAALREAGATFSRTIRTMADEIEEMLQDRTDGIYAGLNREQRYLLGESKRMVGGVRYARYFTAEQLSRHLNGGPLRRNPQAVEGHLAVLAARGLIIPVSREEQAEDTGEYVFGNAYRLPQHGNEDYLTDEQGGVLVTETGEALLSEQVIGDDARLRELERLAAQLKKERFNI